MYQHRYNKYIELCKKQNLDETSYYEVHHILPKSLGGSNHPDNLVKLTPKQHFIAHWLLTKIYPENLKMLQAFHMMGTKGKLIINAKAFEKARIKRSELMKGVTPNHFKENYHPSKMNTKTFSNKVRVFDKNSDSMKSFYVTSEEFEKSENLVSWSSGTTLAYDSKMNRVRVRVGDPRLTSGELTPQGKLVAELNKGENNPMFKGFYITPKGKFTTSREAASANNTSLDSIAKRCMMSHTTIKHANAVKRSKDLKHLDPTDFLGKTWAELGWGFELSST